MHTRSNARRAPPPTTHNAYTSSSLSTEVNLVGDPVEPPLDEEILQDAEEHNHRGAEEHNEDEAEEHNEDKAKKDNHDEAG